MDPLSELFANNSSIRDNFILNRPTGGINSTFNRQEFQQAFVSAMGSEGEGGEGDLVTPSFNKFSSMTFVALQNDKLLNSVITQARTNGIISAAEAVEMSSILEKHQKLAATPDDRLFSILQDYLPEDQSVQFSSDKPLSVADLLQDIYSVARQRLEMFKSAATLAQKNAALTSQQVQDVNELINNNEKFIGLLNKLNSFETNMDEI